MKELRHSHGRSGGPDNREGGDTRLQGAQSMRLLMRARYQFFRERALKPRSWLLLYWALLLFFLTIPFTFALMGENPTATVIRNSATMRRSDNSQLLIYGLRIVIPVMAFAMAALCGRVRPSMRALLAQWPMGLLLFWAFLSILWSDAPVSTFTGVVSMLSILLFAAFLYGSLGARDAARATLLAGTIMAVCSIGYVWAAPTYAIHQHSDSAQAVHAGLWRGVYLHKNHLGQAAAIFAAATFLSGGLIRSFLVRMTMVAILLFLIVKSGSASALLIFPLTVVAVPVLVTFDPLKKAFVLFMAPVLATAAVISFGLLLQMLGKDPTLSGRTVIWDLAADAIGQRPMHGYGFMSPTYGNFVYELYARTFVRDPHNMYLDMLLALGVVGLLLMMWAPAFALKSAGTMYRKSLPLRSGAMCFSALVVGWLVSGLSESNDRPLGVVTTLGFFGLAMLLSCRPALHQVIRDQRAARPKIVLERASIY